MNKEISKVAQTLLDAKEKQIVDLKKQIALLQKQLTEKETQIQKIVEIRQREEVKIAKAAFGKAAEGKTIEDSLKQVEKLRRGESSRIIGLKSMDKAERYHYNKMTMWIPNLWNRLKEYWGESWKEEWRQDFFRVLGQMSKEEFESFYKQFGIAKLVFESAGSFQAERIDFIIFSSITAEEFMEYIIRGRIKEETMSESLHRMTMDRMGE